MAGVTWAIAQNDDPMSELYRHIDVTHVWDPRAIHRVALQRPRPVATARSRPSPRRVGPRISVIFTGRAALVRGQSENVPCSGIEDVYDATNEQPVMLANYLTADHAKLGHVLW